MKCNYWYLVLLSPYIALVYAINRGSNIFLIPLSNNGFTASYIDNIFSVFQG